MKCTCLTQRPDVRHPTQPIFHWNIGCVCYPTRRNLHKKKGNVHGQRKKLASPNARDTNMLVFLALGDAEVLSFALGDAKVPNARYFAFWWNIGLRLRMIICVKLDTCAKNTIIFYPRSRGVQAVIFEQLTPVTHNITPSFSKENVVKGGENIPHPSITTFAQLYTLFSSYSPTCAGHVCTPC